ncbi:ash family protein [Salmonella enterica]
MPYHKDRNLYFLSSSMVAQAGQALAWPVSDDAGIPTPVWAITNERRKALLQIVGGDKLIIPFC